MKTKQGGGILFVEIILFFCILFTHTVMASDGISTIMTYNTNTNEQELSTSKYNIYYAKNYLECEGVEGELVGSSSKELDYAYYTVLIYRLQKIGGYKCI